MKRNASAPFAFLLAALLAATLPGCDSDEPSDPSERTRLLTAEAWVLEGTEVEPDDGSVEITLIAERYDFEEDGDVVVTFEDGTTETGTWQFADSETKIVLDAGTGREVTAGILALSEEDFRFRVSLTVVGREVAVTADLAHP